MDNKQHREQVHFAAAPEALKPGGQVVVASFAEDGPTHCSALPVVRESAAGLQAAFGAQFSRLAQAAAVHHTPGGGQQTFIDCRLRRKAL